MKPRNSLALLFLLLILTACTAVQAPSAPADTGPAAVPSQDDRAAASDDTPPPATLFAGFAEPPTATGDLLLLYGRVLEVTGAPVPGAMVEIWQTDASGVYNHPRDPGTSRRDRSFQFYGAATTDADGWYAFRTVVPGEYEPRPRHIHFKVKQGGKTLLTSQFYFSDDVADVEEEGMFRAAGDGGDLLLLQLVQGDDRLMAKGRIVVDTGAGDGPLPLTPAQGEGPYYPVEPVAEYDNDLVRLP